MSYEVMVPEFRHDVTEKTPIEDQTVYSVSLNVMQKWAKRSGQNLEKRNQIAMEQIRVDRNRGKWLEANIPREGGASGGRPTQNPAKNRPRLPTLKEAGIGHYESPRLRAFAEMTHAQIDAYTSRAKEITETGLYSEYKRLYQTKPAGSVRTRRRRSAALIHGDFGYAVSDFPDDPMDTALTNPPSSTGTVSRHGKSSTRTIEDTDAVRIAFSCERHLWDEFTAYANDSGGNTSSSELRRLVRRYVENHRKMEDKWEIELK